jgi:hypothetical protein
MIGRELLAPLPDLPPVHGMTVRLKVRRMGYRL